MLDNIMKLDEKEATEGLLEGERIFRRAAKNEFGSAAKMEEIMWKQKIKGSLA